MALDPNTLERLKNLVGDQDANTLAPLWTVLWNARIDKDQVIDDLRFQYTLRDAVDVLKAQVAPLVDTKTEHTETDLSQKIKGYAVLREDIDTEILRLEARATANREPAMGELLTQAPRKPGPMVPIPRGPYPNPNDPGYRGDPLRRTIVTDTPQF